MSSDDTLVRYLDVWQRSLARLQRAHPPRWHVRGLSDEEVRDALTLGLFEAVREQRRAAPGAELPARDQAFAILRRGLAQLRKRFRLGAVPTDFGQVALLERDPDQEERFLEEEAEACRAGAAARARGGLSTPQRRWLSAFQLAARGGHFFEASAQPNLSAASRMLGKHRSSAQRAYQELQTQFQRELARRER